MQLLTTILLELAGKISTAVATVIFNLLNMWTEIKYISAGPSMNVKSRSQILDYISYSNPLSPSSA
jgi:hypothetical protein